MVFTVGPLDVRKAGKGFFDEPMFDPELGFNGFL